MTFLEKLDALVEKNNSLLCVGLDPDLSKLPTAIDKTDQPLFTFNKAIIDSTADLVCAFKPNSAFYEGSGLDGINELKLTCDYLKQNYPEVPIILDFKRADIGNTNNHYANFAFDYLGVDAVTVHPYLGREAIQTFLDYKDKGIIILCRTSNPGASEFQDLPVNGRKLYEVVAEQVASHWNTNNNCLLVAGATYPEELAKLRAVVGDEMVFLVPGIGAQGGDAEATVKAGINKAGKGLIVSSSRDILYASGDNYAEAARLKAKEQRDKLNQFI